MTQQKQKLSWGSLILGLRLWGLVLLSMLFSGAAFGEELEILVPMPRPMTHKIEGDREVPLYPAAGREVQKLVVAYLRNHFQGNSRVTIRPISSKPSHTKISHGGSMADSSVDPEAQSPGLEALAQSGKETISLEFFYYRWADSIFFDPLVQILKPNLGLQRTFFRGSSVHRFAIPLDPRNREHGIRFSDRFIQDLDSRSVTKEEIDSFINHGLTGKDTAGRNPLNGLVKTLSIFSAYLLNEFEDVRVWVSEYGKSCENKKPELFRCSFVGLHQLLTFEFAARSLEESTDLERLKWSYEEFKYSRVIAAFYILGIVEAIDKSWEENHQLEQLSQVVAEAQVLFDNADPFLKAVQGFIQESSSLPLKTGN